MPALPQVKAEEVTATYKDPGTGADRNVTYRTGDRLVPASVPALRHYEPCLPAGVRHGEIVDLYAGVDVPLAVRWSDEAGPVPWVVCVPVRLVRPAGD